MFTYQNDQNLKTLRTPNAGEDMEQQESSFVAGGMQNGPALVEDSMSVSYKPNHTV